uniref:Uncharacterized protein n=1 Tax=Arcella intermedia TaxID=1963864 RepID=A0A6B2L928_9EUKA
MGCHIGKSDAFNKENKKLREKLEREIKILLLGTGDSGKSTVLKQLKLIHMNGFTEEELKAFTAVVLGNLVGSLQCLVKGVIAKAYKLEKENEEIAQEIVQVGSLKEINEDLKNRIPEFMNDKAISLALKTSLEFYLPDSATYFFENLDRILADDYIPTIEDVIRARLKTIGINEVTFEVDKLFFKIVDVGGQRSERRKWIHCFEDVTAIIFCVSLNEYNLMLEEDSTVNRMHESVQLFTEICDSPYFRNSAILLFFNKKDLFEVKIKQIPLSVCYSNAPNGKSYEEGLKYLEQKFVKIGKKKGKIIYPHVTHATDRDCIKFVFGAIRETILSQAFSV